MSSEYISPIVGRARHSAGTVQGRMVIWGGVNSHGALMDGAIYDPRDGLWVTIPTPPMHEVENTSVCIGDDCLAFWGGMYHQADQGEWEPINEGAIYDYLQESWVRFSDGPLSPRVNHVLACVQGGRFLIWGGNDGTANSATFRDGSVYDPVDGSWTPLSEPGLPLHANTRAFWLDGELLVWEMVGEDSPQWDSGAPVSGAVLRTLLGRWNAINVPAELGRAGPCFGLNGKVLVLLEQGRSAIWDPKVQALEHLSSSSIVHDSWPSGFASQWTGSELVLWGGQDSRGEPNDRAFCYDGRSGTWKVLAGAATARGHASAALLGKDILFWGGRSGSRPTSRRGLGRKRDVPVVSSYHNDGWLLREADYTVV